MILTDTDSMYIQTATETFEGAVKPKKLREYRKRIKNFHQHDDVRHPKAFLVRKCCKRHEKLDEKFPGLFKVCLFISIIHIQVQYNALVLTHESMFSSQPAIFIQALIFAH